LQTSCAFRWKSCCFCFVFAQKSWKTDSQSLLWFVNVYYYDFWRLWLIEKYTSWCSAAVTPFMLATLQTEANRCSIVQCRLFRNFSFSTWDPRNFPTQNWLGLFLVTINRTSLWANENPVDHPSPRKYVTAV